MPFPNRLVAGNPLHKIAFETIDVEPHQFELAKLTEALSWMTRLELTRGGGSGTKKPEPLASRGLNTQKVRLGRRASPKEAHAAFAPSVLQNGNCAENARFVKCLAETVDTELLSSLGVELQAERIRTALIEDGPHDHTWAVLAIDEDMPNLTRKGTLPEAAAKVLWAADAHQSYPMASRHDHSTYNHLDHAYANLSFLSNRGFEFNLAASDKVREQLKRNIGLGEKSIDRALQEPIMLQKKIHSRFVKSIMRQQNVGHYAQVDTGILPAADREKFQAKVAGMEKEIGRKTIKALYKNGAFEGDWLGLCIDLIENSPFSSALTAASQLDYSMKQPGPQELEAYKTAYSAMASWIDRMHREMHSTPGLLAQVQKARYHETTRAQLMQA